MLHDNFSSWSLKALLLSNGVSPVRKANWKPNCNHHYCLYVLQFSICHHLELQLHSQIHKPDKLISQSLFPNNGINCLTIHSFKRWNVLYLFLYVLVIKQWKHFNACEWLMIRHKLIEIRKLNHNFIKVTKRILTMNRKQNTLNYAWKWQRESQYL